VQVTACAQLEVTFVPVYLDHAATTPMLPEAIAAYIAALDLVGNPSSIHSQGQNAKRMLEEAREHVAESLGCDPIEVVFTSGGTEAVNLAVKGLYWARNFPSGDRVASAGERIESSRRRILVPRGEHHATIDTVEWLERYEGAIIDWLPIDSLGRVRLDALAASLEEHDDVALLTLLWANNEVGTVQPVAEAVALASRYGVPVHCDAISAYRHLPIDFAASGLAALSVSAHKIGGPLGIGALILDRSAVVVPLIHGGGQQRDVRSGTQDVPAAISFGVAAKHPLSSFAALRARGKRPPRQQCAFHFSRVRGRLSAFPVGCRENLGEHRLCLSGRNPGGLACAPRNGAQRGGCARGSSHHCRLHHYRDRHRRISPRAARGCGSSDPCRAQRPECRRAARQCRCLGGSERGGAESQCRRSPPLRSLFFSQ